MIPDKFELNVHSNNDEALSCIWNGGKMLANSKDFSYLVVTKKMYEEHGHSICKKKFDLYQA